jgi:hypothetical protein
MNHKTYIHENIGSPTKQIKKCLILCFPKNSISKKVDLLNFDLPYQHSKKNYLTVSVVPVISTNNLVSPLVAGPKTNDPSEPKVDPCAAHKKDDFVLLYSTVAPA